MGGVCDNESFYTCMVSSEDISFFQVILINPAVPQLPNCPLLCYYRQFKNPPFRKRIKKKKNTSHFRNLYTNHVVFATLTVDTSFSLCKLKLKSPLFIWRVNKWINEQVSRQRESLEEEVIIIMVQTLQHPFVIPGLPTRAPSLLLYPFWALWIWLATPISFLSPPNTTSFLNTNNNLTSFSNL